MENEKVSMTKCRAAFEDRERTLPVEPYEHQIWICAWNAAIKAAVETVPGGDVCDPQLIADNIRKLIET